MLRKVTKTCSTRASTVQDSQTGDLSAIALIVPLACESEQVGDGFPALTMTPLLPLLKKPTKQELPQPLSQMVVNIAVQWNVLRKRNRENRMASLKDAKNPIGGPQLEH
jgi:hypothetical protein